MVGTLYIKAATHELMKYNSLRGAPAYFYSFENKGKSSIFNSIPNLFFGSRYTNNVKFIFIGTPRRLNKSKDQGTVKVGCTPRTLSCYPRWALLSLITQSNWNKILYTDRRSELRLKPKLPVVCWEGLRLK